MSNMVTVSSQHVTVYNGTDVPVIVDGAGHLLGGREFGSVNTNAREAKQAIDLGSLSIVDDPGGDLADADVRDDAAAAFRATREANGDNDKPAARSAKAGAKAPDKNEGSA